MKTDCLAIIMALEGQGEFLRELFGSSEPGPPKAETLPPITQGAFSQMFKKAA